MHILIIEDDPSEVVSYRMVAEQIGVSSLVTFDNLKQARSYLKNNLVDIVIADIYLGEHSGLDLLPELKENGCSIIVVTGYPSEDHMSVVLKHNVDRFLSKPVGIQTLKHELLHIIEQRNNAETNSFLFHYNKNRIIRIPFSDILYFKTEGNYTTLYRKEKKIVIKKSLRIISKDLPEYFQHSYRNIVINSNYIESIDYTKNLIELTNGDRLSIGNAYKKTLKNYMLKHYNII